MMRMSDRRFNWLLWSGLALTLFASAIVLLIGGVRRADRKVLPVIITFVGIAIFAFFIFAVTIASKQIPAAHGAPRVGQKAPEFALVDTEHHPVTLSSLVAGAPKGVLLIFYRGYW